MSHIQRHWVHRIKCISLFWLCTGRNHSNITSEDCGGSLASCFGNEVSCSLLGGGNNRVNDNSYLHHSIIRICTIRLFSFTSFLFCNFPQPPSYELCLFGLPHNSSSQMSQKCWKKMFIFLFKDNSSPISTSESVYRNKI